MNFARPIVFNTSGERSRNLALLFLLLFPVFHLQAQSHVPPRPDHLVVCILENRGYEDIIGNSNASFINQLAFQNALLAESYAIGHPSQPNYIRLYSGSSQGVTDDVVPVNTPWTTPNLGAELINAGFTFKAYSEDLPYPGFLGDSYLAYRRRHAPWANWQGTGLNQVPDSVHVPLTDFPANYSLLPDVSFVIPNLDNGMHDGSTAQGDAWLQSTLASYINWCKVNNSVFLLTFDEDDGDNFDHIVTVFVGEQVISGVYDTIGYSHYDILRTILDMYGLPSIANTANAEPVLEIWQPGTTVQVPESKINSKISVAPNPFSGSTEIFIPMLTDDRQINTIVYNCIGEIISSSQYAITRNKNYLRLRNHSLLPGIYFLQVPLDSGFIQTLPLVIQN